MWFHWIFCFQPWKDTFPGKQHLGLIDILQLSESPVIYFCPPLHQRLILWQSPLTHSTQISLNPAHSNPQRMGNDLQRHWGLQLDFLMVQLCGQHCGQAGSGVGPVLLLLYLLTSRMGHLGAGPIKFAWITMPLTLLEIISPLTVFCRFSIHVLPFRRVVKVPG